MRLTREDNVKAWNRGKNMGCSVDGYFNVSTKRRTDGRTVIQLFTFGQGFRVM